jgi:hypothetical protein
MDNIVTISESDIETVPNTPESGNHQGDEGGVQDRAAEDTGFIGELHPLNRDAKDAFHRLGFHRHDDMYEHHCRFMRIDSVTPQLGGCFIFSLSDLPEFAPLGWRIGRGRKIEKNLGVDILLLIEEGRDEVAGRHARFAWMKGGGGFFLVADNLRGKTVTLNGEELSNEQRLIPYRNTIGIGECYFTFKFAARTPEQDEQFQTELATFYSIVLNNAAPLVVPTPSEQEVMMGDWVVRHAIAKGSFGHVYVVTHARTGRAAAAKELWRTPQNKSKVDKEVSMANLLVKINHVCTDLCACQS